jgi:hypothetical protein
MAISPKPTLKQKDNQLGRQLVRTREPIFGPHRKCTQATASFLLKNPHPCLHIVSASALRQNMPLCSPLKIQAWYMISLLLTSLITRSYGSTQMREKCFRNIDTLFAKVASAIPLTKYSFVL